MEVAISVLAGGSGLMCVLFIGGYKSKKCAFSFVLSINTPSCDGSLDCSNVVAVDLC